MNIRRFIVGAAITSGLLAIAVITLTPTSRMSHLPFWCLTCGERPGVDVLLNVLLFVPLGVGLGLTRLAPLRAIGLAILVTVVVEALQLVTVPGRYPSARDIVANSVGGAIGVFFGRHWASIVFATYRPARVLAALSIAAWLGSQALASWAMGLAPPPPPWWVQLKPQYDRYPRVFAGDIVASSIGSVPMATSDQLSNPAEARRQLIEGGPLRTVVTNMLPTPGIAPIVIMSGGPFHDVAFWAQDGADAIFAVAVRGTRIGLRAPSVRITDVVPRLPRDTLALTGSYADGRYRLSATRNGETVNRELAASPSIIWGFLLPLPAYAFGSDVRIFTALWLIAVWTLISYWGVRSAHPGDGRIREIAVLAGVAAIGLALVPVVAGLPAAHWSEWIGVGIGGALGWSIGLGAIPGRRRDQAAASPLQAVHPGDARHGRSVEVSI